MRKVLLHNDDQQVMQNILKLYKLYPTCYLLSEEQHHLLQNTKDPNIISLRLYQQMDDIEAKLSEYDIMYRALKLKDLFKV